MRRDMFRRSKLPIVFLVVSLGAMVGIGAGLFQWLNGLSEYEARQLHVDLSNGAGRIQSDVALELSVIAATLSYGMDKQKTEWSPSAMEEYISDLYTRWTVGTRFPELVDGIYLVDLLSASPAVPRSVRMDRGVAKHRGDEPHLAKDLTSGEDESGLYRIVYHPDGLALVLPVIRYREHESGETGWEEFLAGYVVVALDREYFVGEVVARLFNSFLGSGEQFSYAVVGSDPVEVLAASPWGAPISVEDVVSGEVDERTRLTAWIGSESSLLESSALSRVGLSTPFRDLFVRQWFGLSRNADGAPLVRLPNADESRETPAVAGSGQQLEPELGIDLYIRHSAGSIDRATKQSRDRRLAIGYSVLASFALVAVVFYLLYLRALGLRDREHEFVATVTHELRTPVSGVSAVADNLAAGIVKDPAQVIEYGRAILDQGVRLRRLIDQILLYAGLSSGMRDSGTEVIDLAQFTRAAVSRVPEITPKRLIVHVQPGLRSYRGDPIAIETIVSNLVSNAAKHGGETATVTVGVYRETLRKHLWLTIRVSDTGGGIPRRELGKVLEPFYRGEGSHMQQRPGSGVGLSLVDRIVRTCGGQLSISSPKGGGTTVSVRLPFSEETQ
jgi:signal transduction histidine kinase